MTTNIGRTCDGVSKAKADERGMHSRRCCSVTGSRAAVPRRERPAHSMLKRRRLNFSLCLHPQHLVGRLAVGLTDATVCVIPVNILAVGGTPIEVQLPVFLWTQGLGEYDRPHGGEQDDKLKVKRKQMQVSTKRLEEAVHVEGTSDAEEEGRTRQSKCCWPSGR